MVPAKLVVATGELVAGYIAAKASDYSRPPECIMNYDNIILYYFYFRFPSDIIIAERLIDCVGA